MGVGTLAWDEPAADKFAEVRVNLERVGTPIGAFDKMIAAHAMAAKVTLVTNNEKHFRLVKGLAVETWAESIQPRRI
jgi:tRNA(fMet)-specific endonuclease VapC